MNAKEPVPPDTWTFPWYAPRTWHGMTVSTWWRLLAGQRFAVAPARVGLATTVTIATLINSAIGGVERAIFERKANSFRLKRQPLFLIGHWRTGTTFLHELLAQDDQFYAPNTYQCMQPHHFLCTESWLKPAFSVLMPSRRPMDKMAAGFDLPQEDEFALMNLGLPSPYLFWAFPNRPIWCQHYLDFEGLDETEVERWKTKLMWFVKRLALRNPRRLVLKSPTHTARVKWILELFPAAKFIHLVRNPLKVIPSTIYTWRQLSAALTFQGRLTQDLEDHALDSFTRMYRSFESQRSLIPAGHFHELRFEDLMADPLGQLRELYERLSLGEFDQVEPAFAEYLRDKRDHTRFQHELSPELRARIKQTCGDYMRKHGYA